MAPSSGLYQFFTPTTKAYAKTLLKDKSPSDDPLTTYITFSP